MKREKTNLHLWDRRKKYFIDMSVRINIIVEDDDKQIEDIFLNR
jgi:hypothetical protein